MNLEDRTKILLKHFGSKKNKKKQYIPKNLIEMMQYITEYKIDSLKVITQFSRTLESYLYDCKDKEKYSSPSILDPLINKLDKVYSHYGIPTSEPNDNSRKAEDETKRKQAIREVLIQNFDAISDASLVFRRIYFRHSTTSLPDIEISLNIDNSEQRLNIQTYKFYNSILRHEIVDEYLTNILDKESDMAIESQLKPKDLFRENLIRITQDLEKCYTEFEKSRPETLKILDERDYINWKEHILELIRIVDNHINDLTRAFNTIQRLLKNRYHKLHEYGTVSPEENTYFTENKNKTQKKSKANTQPIENVEHQSQQPTDYEEINEDETNEDPILLFLKRPDEETDEDSVWLNLNSPYYETRDIDSYQSDTSELNEQFKLISDLCKGDKVLIYMIILIFWNPKTRFTL